MTEKQKAFLKHLPECNNNVAEAGRRAGYSPNTVKNKLYTLVRNSKGIKLDDEETVKKRYTKETRKLKKRFLKEGDNSNASRMHEAEGRIKGLFKDKIEQTGSPNVISINYEQSAKPIKDNELSKEQGVRGGPLESDKGV